MQENFKMAVDLGFNEDWLSEVVTKWGADILNLLISLVQNGFSVGLIVEFIQKIGPGLLQLLVDMLSNRTMAMDGGEVVVPHEWINAQQFGLFDGSIINSLLEKYLPVLVEKYLPLLVEKYGNLFVQLVLDFLKNLEKKG